LNSLRNALELYSLHFITGIAHSDPAFLATGKAFCRIVEKQMIYIKPLYENGQYYSHTVKLSIKWSQLLERQKAETDFKKAAKNLYNMPNTSKLHIVGTDV
jgi:hypothetical protein